MIFRFFNLLFLVLLSFDTKATNFDSLHCEGYDLSRFNGIVTIDDGPSDVSTSILVDCLRVTNISRDNVVFFFTGEKLKAEPDLVKKVIKAGFEIGYHSMDHRNHVYLSANDIVNDISDFKEILAAICPNYILKLGRPPYGGMTSLSYKNFLNAQSLISTPIESLTMEDMIVEFVSEKVGRIYKENNIEILLWHRDFGDWENKIIRRNEVSAFYKSNEKQIWLFHESPYSKGLDFPAPDENIIKNMNIFLSEISRLEKEAKP